MTAPRPYCAVHDQPEEWCEAGYASAGEGSSPCPAMTRACEGFEYRTAQSAGRKAALLRLPFGKEAGPCSAHCAM